MTTITNVRDSDRGWVKFGGQPTLAFLVAGKAYLVGRVSASSMGGCPTYYEHAAFATAEVFHPEPPEGFYFEHKGSRGGSIGGMLVSGEAVKIYDDPPSIGIFASLIEVGILNAGWEDMEQGGPGMGPWIRNGIIANHPPTGGEAGE
mgnify:CR=1 FL=1